MSSRPPNWQRPVQAPAPQPPRVPFEDLRSEALHSQLRGLKLASASTTSQLVREHGARQHRAGWQAGHRRGFVEGWAWGMACGATASVCAGLLLRALGVL